MRRRPLPTGSRDDRRFEAAECRPAPNGISAISIGMPASSTTSSPTGCTRGSRSTFATGCMALCRELLAPQGVVYLSYNTWPGRHARHILREMMLYHLRDIRGAAAALARSAPIPARDRYSRTRARCSARPDDVLFHDDLAPVNDPVWFRDFVAHAARHGLQFLGEARARSARPARSKKSSTAISSRMRSFRQSLLCRAEVTAESRPHARAHAALSVLARQPGSRSTVP